MVRSLDPQVRASDLPVGSPEAGQLARTWGSKLRDVRLAGLCVLAFAWLFGMLCVPPDYQGIGRSPSVLYYQRTEGYFHQAAFEVTDSREFLRNYRNLIGSGNDPDRYLHLGTHPPGLTLGYRGLLTLFEWSPQWAEALIAIEPPAIREGFAALRQFPTPREQLLTTPEEATLWAATLLTLAAAAATCWPIYRLAARMGGPVVGWRAAVLWPLVPSLLVFFPKSDLLCPLIGTASCWLWLDGWSRLRWGRCVLAGAGFFAGLLLTLALAPIALLLVVQTILERWTGREEFADRRVWTDVATVLAALVGFLVPLIALSAWGGCNVFAIWLQSLSNHALFYDHNPRNYGAWLAVNPLEAAFALGIPLACLVVAGALSLECRRFLRNRCLRRLCQWFSTGNVERAISEKSPTFRQPARSGFATDVRDAHALRWAVAFSQTVAWGVVWAFLWLSGKNMGEAARLWIFLAPWAVMTAALVWQSPGDATLGLSTRDEIERQRSWKWLLALQLLACLWTSAWVDGFHFADLLPK